MDHMGFDCSELEMMQSPFCIVEPDCNYLDEGNNLAEGVVRLGELGSCNLWVDLGFDCSMAHPDYIHLDEENESPLSIADYIHPDEENKLAEGVLPQGELPSCMLEVHEAFDCVELETVAALPESAPSMMQPEYIDLDDENESAPSMMQHEYIDLDEENESACTMMQPEYIDLDEETELAPSTLQPNYIHLNEEKRLAEGVLVLREFWSSTVGNHEAFSFDYSQWNMVAPILGLLPRMVQLINRMSRTSGDADFSSAELLVNHIMNINEVEPEAWRFLDQLIQLSITSNQTSR